jgi:hypothetical protein
MLHLTLRVCALCAQEKRDSKAASGQMLQNIAVFVRLEPVGNDAARSNVTIHDNTLLQVRSTPLSSTPRFWHALCHVQRHTHPYLVRAPPLTT